jgi:hypothetical protein
MFMSQPRQFTEIDSLHCSAICEEIGYRLGQFLKTREIPELPPQLIELLDRLCQQDREAAPSIVPSVADMELPEDAQQRD